MSEPIVDYDRIEQAKADYKIAPFGDYEYEKICRSGKMNAVGHMTVNGKLFLIFEKDQQTQFGTRPPTSVGEAEAIIDEMGLDNHFGEYVEENFDGIVHESAEDRALMTTAYYEQLEKFDTDENVRLLTAYTGDLDGNLLRSPNGDTTAYLYVELEPTEQFGR